MADHRTQNLMRCTELTRAIRAAGGQTSNAIEKAVSDGRIYWLVQDAANPHDDDGNLLAFISAEFGLNLMENQITALLQNKKDEAQRKLTESIRDQSNDVDRILMCLGPEAIRRYVPALAKLNNKAIHAPWLAKPLELEESGLVLGRDYPRPIVDHAEARTRTLERYAVVKKVK
jgi:hypothetical protein